MTSVGEDPCEYVRDARRFRGIVKVTISTEASVLCRFLSFTRIHASEETLLCRSALTYFESNSLLVILAKHKKRLHTGPPTAQCVPTMTMKGKDVISIRDFSRGDIEHVFRTAEKLRPIADGRTKSTLLQDKILAALFFQPSTRTRLSFESAMQRLGGSVVGFASPEVTRAGDVYAETLKDTGEMVQLYSDVIVVRHPEAEAPAILAETVDIPVISGGAGITSTSKSGSVGEHPTQTLLDLYTISREKRRIDGLSILLMGNLGSRAIHSLGIGVSRFDGVQIYLLAPESLGLPDVAKRDFESANLRCKAVSSINDVIKKLDVIYVVSMRQALGVETTPDPYRLDMAKLKEAKSDLIVLHPLPRMDEISTEVDKTPYAKYYAQAYNGLVARMALLALVLGREP